MGLRIRTRSGDAARWRAVAALGLAALGGCDGPEGAFEGPAGFSTDESARSALAPATLTRDQGRLVTRALRAIEGHDANAPIARLPPLGAQFGGRYDEGLRLVASANAAAFVEVAPLGAASHAPARLRHDGALIAYDDAYPGISAAVGASDERVEATLRVPSAAEAPPLRYRLRGSPAFGSWQGDKAGACWAYDRDGRGLLRLAPPSVHDATGRTVEGRWRAHDEGGETIVEAELPWRELAFPVLVSVAFETPTWFPAGGDEVPSPRATAGLTFYGGGQNCAVLFGGFSGQHPAIVLHNDVAVRCEGSWQVGPGGAGIPTGESKPSPRQNARIAYAPFAAPNHAGAYVFGGLGDDVLDDLWQLVLQKEPDGRRSAVWTQILPPQPKTSDNWPSPRSDAGLAWTGSHLLLFGGGPLNDTWRFDGINWQRVCQGAGCFPPRREFSVVSHGLDESLEVLAFGGLEQASPSSFAFTNQWLRFTGGGWQPLAVMPAKFPTVLDGSLSFEEGDAMAVERWGAWAAAGPGGQVLVGSGQSDVFGLTADADVWRLAPEGLNRRWARVPVTTSLPGRHWDGGAVFDPVREETLVLSGITEITSVIDPNVIYNAAPPVAYRGRTGGVSMTVTCRDPEGDGDCNAYTLEANASLEGDSTPSRARAIFLRQRGITWSSAGPACGSDEAPLAPQADGTLRCDVAASLNDVGFAVQVRDGGYAPGGSLCSPTPNDSLPFCNESNVYAGTVVCSRLPFENSDAVACP